MVELTPREVDLLDAYVASFLDFAGDRRTARLLAGTVRGIVVSERLVCARIAAFSPALAGGRHSEKRLRRMLHGQTTKRSTLDPDALVARLQARGVEQLRGEDAIWVVFDGTDVRKPHAERMEHLQRVKRLDGNGTVPGYPTLNVLGIGKARRGLLYHTRSSSAAPDFRSASAEVRTAVQAVGGVLAPRGADVTAIYDSGFDDQAVWGETWDAGMHLLCRVYHRDRLMRPAAGAPPCHLEDLAPRLQPRARLEAEMVVRKASQPRPKLQPVTVTVTATPLVVPYHRSVATGAVTAERACWLVQARLERVPSEPWWLLTDRPVETEEQAAEVFRM